MERYAVVVVVTRGLHTLADGAVVVSVVPHTVARPSPVPEDGPVTPEVGVGVGVGVEVTVEMAVGVKVGVGVGRLGTLRVR